MNSIQKMCVVLGTALLITTIINGVTSWMYYLQHKVIFSMLYLFLACIEAGILGATVRLYVESRE